MSLAAFRSVTLHGSVLPADALTRAADLGMSGQSSDDYQLTPGLAINSAVARSWSDLLVAYERRQTSLQAARGDAATRLTRDRWLLPLLAELGYGRVPAVPAGLDLPPGLGETKPTHYPISHQLAWPPGDPTPSAAIAIHLLGDEIELDKRTVGVTARAPHGMVQEFLNRSEEHLYAILATGRIIRLLRDASSLAKQSYVEFDLDLMFREQLFADFRLLWLTLHATRLTPRILETTQPGQADLEPIDDVDNAAAAPVLPSGPRPDDCWLEQWRTQAISDGSRARELLEAGVARAITALGTGFVSHPDNDQLRTALMDNSNTDQDLRRWLLRVVYRYIVLFVAEDRDLLHPVDDGAASTAARTLYHDHFSTARLRDLASTRNGTRHSDLWDASQIVTRALGTNGSLELALPPLASSLYDPHGVGLLNGARITNRFLLEAIRHLAQVRDKRTGIPVRVDYRNLDSEELGGIYEGLLAYVPRYDPAARTFTLTTTAGSERKTSGSYYTPSSLIALVLDEALDPLIDSALRTPDPEQAILDLTVCDPACGSGHFLVAAARRLARALALVRTGDPEPPPAAVREAMRDVVSRCIYGVDLNDLAIEVAKVALWLEALTPGKPFAFLDHHLKVGNALLGTTPKLLAGNVPDDAFQVLHGDDRAFTAKLKARNKAERRHEEAQAAGQLSWDMGTLDAPTVDLSERARDLNASPSDTIADVRARADAWRRLESDPDLQAARLLHDAWCAAFVQDKRSDLGPRLTHSTLTSLRRDPDLVLPQTKELIEQTARQYRFFHWHLEFPGVFRVLEPGSPVDSAQGWNGGFSAVLGNPPWENYRPLDKEYFEAAGRSDIVNARTSAIRTQMIEDLKDTDPALHLGYWKMQRAFQGDVNFLAKSGRFPLNGTGNMTTHDLFAEHCRDVTAANGSSGVLVPTSVMTGAQTAPFVADLLEHEQLAAFYDFTNQKKMFAIHSSYRFGVLCIRGRRRRAETVQLAFQLTSTNDVTANRLITLTAEDLARINPNTKNLPVFASPVDAKITAAIHAKVPILRHLGNPAGDPWQIGVGSMLDMTHDAHLFKAAGDLEAQGGTFDGVSWTIGDNRFLTLHEGKHIWHYDHRYATGQGMSQDRTREVVEAEHAAADFEIQTRHYVAESEVNRKLSRRTSAQWLIGWRDIARADDQRTLIPALFPRAAVGNTLPLSQPNSAEDSIALLSALSSLVCDYVVRQKSSGAHVSKGQLNQTPVPHPTTFAQPVPWQPGLVLHQWLLPRVLELVYTSWSMKPWAIDVGDHEPPFIWDAERRAVLRAEVDGAMLHIYNLERDDALYVLGTFRALRDAEARAHGEFRTKRLVLAEYDRMALATKAGGLRWASTLEFPAGLGPRHSA